MMKPLYNKLGKLFAIQIIGDREKHLKVKALYRKSYRSMWHEFTRISVEPQLS